MQGANVYLGVRSETDALTMASKKQHNTRLWVRDIPTDQLPYEIEHCRRLWACIRDGRYDVHYAIVIGVYRAELARRS